MLVATLSLRFPVFRRVGRILAGRVRSRTQARVCQKPEFGSSYLDQQVVRRSSFVEQREECLDSAVEPIPTVPSFGVCDINRIELSRSLRFIEGQYDPRC